MNKNTKRKVYLAIWYVAAIEFVNFITIIARWAYEAKTGDYPMNTLWAIIFAVSTILGIFLARWAGPKAWQKIYVEGTRGKKYIAK